MPDREEKYFLILLRFKIKDVKVVKFTGTNSIEASFYDGNLQLLAIGYGLWPMGSTKKIMQTVVNGYLFPQGMKEYFTEYHILSIDANYLLV